MSTRNEPNPLILIVEDEVELSQVIARHLEEAGMSTQVCNRAGHALKFLEKNFANLVLLDLKLPDQTGFQLVEDLRKHDIQVPIIFLTGNNAEVTKVKGLEVGDDYVTKPFSFQELIARIKAVLRRAETSRDFNVTKNARLSDEAFDFCGAKVIPTRLELEFPGGRFVPIGRKELGILAYLFEHRGTVVSRKNIIHSVWGVHANVRSRSFDQYIVKIRDHFTSNGMDLSPLRTVHGVGYVYDPDGETSRGVADGETPAGRLSGKATDETLC